MHLKKFASILLGLAIATVFVGSAVAALSQDRATNMKQIRYDYGMLWQMLRNGQFDAAETHQRGRDIADSLAHLKDLFPAGSQQVDGRAGSSIWSDRAGFEAVRTRAYQAAVAMSKAQDASTLRNSFLELGHACRACHDKFATLN